MLSGVHRLALSSALLLLAGCARQPITLNPGDTSSQPVCPSGPHLLVGAVASGSPVSQTLLRYDASLQPCRGLQLDYSTYGSLTLVGGLQDGTDLVGFVGDYGRGGSLVHVDGGMVLDRIDRDDLSPISVSPITFQSQPAVAVLWGDASSSSDSGDTLEIYREQGWSLVGSWHVSYEFVRVSAAPSGQPDRIAGLIHDGLQEYRVDPGAASLATTGELQVAIPNNAYSRSSLDVLGTDVRVGTKGGVLSWSAGLAPAFLGPVACNSPDPAGTPLPAEDAEYVGAVLDAGSAGGSLALVHGAIRGGSGTATYLYRMGAHGECTQLGAYPSDYSAASIAWSGR